MVKTIIGIADIHIPLFQKLTQFQLVFENLYKQLQDYDKDETVVVIAGDIAYAKSHLTPQFVITFKQFLQSISKNFRTVIIPGNHDANLANTQRTDTITSMLYGMDDSNITYYKETGIYDYDDIKFAVFSCIDGLKPQIPTDSDKPIVGLFHDTLYGARNDFGFTFTDDTYKLSDFDYCDYVVCGHIHKYQVMQKRDKENNKPLIFYTGSLLQQNHGQSIDGHGFVQLDIQTGNHKLIQVKNDHTYLTLQFVDGQLQDIPQHIPKNVKLVVKLTNTEMNTALAIVNQRLSENNLQSIKYLKKNETNQDYDLQFKDKIYANITNEYYQTQLIMDYVKNKLNVKDQHKLQLIKLLNSEYNKRISINDNDYGKN